MEGGSKLTPVAKRLEGKVALITGGASGIGEATVRLFVHHGAKVVICDIQDSLGLLISKELEVDENVTFIHCDVTKEIDVKFAMNTAVSKYGKLDIVFSNAGISGEFGLNILQSTSEEFKRVFDINVYGSFLCAKHAARVMIPAKKGSIIFTASVASVIAGKTSTCLHYVKACCCGDDKEHVLRVRTVWY